MVICSVLDFCSMPMQTVPWSEQLGNELGLVWSIQWVDRIAIRVAVVLRRIGLFAVTDGMSAGCPTTTTMIDSQGLSYSPVAAPRRASRVPADLGWAFNSTQCEQLKRWKTLALVTSALVSQKCRTFLLILHHSGLSLAQYLLGITERLTFSGKKHKWFLLAKK